MQIEFGTFEVFTAVKIQVEVFRVLTLHGATTQKISTSCS